MCNYDNEISEYDKRQNAMSYAVSFLQHNSLHPGETLASTALAIYEFLNGPLPKPPVKRRKRRARRVV